PECQADCEAETFTVHLDSKPGKEVLLKLTNHFFFCRYLIFKRMRTRAGARGTWFFLGKIDWDDNKYEDSWHQVRQTGHKHWLIIRGQTGSGTGFESYDDTWYDVSKRGIRIVLNYTAKEGIYQWPKGVGWKLRSRIMPSSGHKSTVGIRFRASYTGLNYITNKYPFLFSKTRSIMFKWNSREKRFAFSNSGSQVSKEEFESVYQGRSWNEDAVLKYNLHDFEKIANGVDNKRKEWLRDFLTGCKNTAEKAALLQALRPLPV
ncbi:MAG: hypothetical protein ACREAC_18405, partial [Blastocatellia bacterium]